jgi:hypothetical protein
VQAAPRLTQCRFLVTDYTRNAVVHGGVLDPGVNLLSKPYTLERLAAKVRKVLDG